MSVLVGEKCVECPLNKVGANLVPKKAALKCIEEQKGTATF